MKLVVLSKRANIAVDPREYYVTVEAKHGNVEVLVSHNRFSRAVIGNKVVVTNAELNAGQVIRDGGNK